ncbi:MAG: FAD-binding oxidoreductase [Bacteroidota bacterium]
MPVKWFDCHLVRTEDTSKETKRFWLEIQDENHFDFQAGQFVTMDLPVGEKRLQRWRSYSIANPPDGSNLLEFCIVHLDGGLATQYLFDVAKPGTNIRFKGPDGAFVLPEKIEKDLVFICTGTGVAPFRSMIQDLHRKNLPHQNIHLIFGTRWKDGILYREEFETLAQTMPGFRYSVALSREEELPPDGQNMEFRRGYVHQFYLENYAGKPLTDVDFYICGWSKMIDEAVANLLLKLGCERSQIKYELYG